jgi:hypothetical protein
MFSAMSFVVGAAAFAMWYTKAMPIGIWSFFPGLLELLCWLFGAVGVIGALIYVASNKGFGRYILLFFCIAAVAVPTVVCSTIATTIGSAGLH